MAVIGTISLNNIHFDSSVLYCILHCTSPGMQCGISNPQFYYCGQSCGLVVSAHRSDTLKCGAYAGDAGLNLVPVIFWFIFNKGEMFVYSDEMVIKQKCLCIPLYSRVLNKKMAI